MEKEYKYLGRVNTPEDLKKLGEKEIPELCQEIRDCIIETTEKNGGHLASNLGAVELTVAIHRVFDCPSDHIIFDVGHQSYTHKLLTERYSSFSSLRLPGGMSGFTSPAESKYDCFGAGHSSTSVSAALGIATADKLSGSDNYTVAVLGDGAFTGGMIHEALNNCDKDLKLIIILNENEMSISKNIGRFAGSIAKLRRKSGYFKAKKFTVSFIKKIPLIGKGLFKLIRNIKKSVKNSLYGSNYFEDIGLYYLGPADGNDYSNVKKLLEIAKGCGESVIVHLKTKKGKGYEPAEKYPDIYHGVKAGSQEAKAPSFSSKFGETLCSLAEKDEKICAITAAMSQGTGLDVFAEKYPERFFDVGIAEEHAATFAAGLAANGYKPVFAVYSTFLQRSYDQMLHDIALQRLPVVFCVDRAGFNESDGVTHHGIFDVAFTSQMPGFKIYAPITLDALENALCEALNGSCPAIIRYPSGIENSEVKNSFYPKENDRKVGIRWDFDLENAPESIIVTHGRMVNECMRAKAMLEEEDISVGIILCEYLAPYDMLANELCDLFEKILPSSLIFAEEEIRNGGFGMLLSDAIKKQGRIKGIRYDIVAASDPFVKRREGERFIEASGISASDISCRMKSLVDKNTILNTER